MGPVTLALIVNWRAPHSQTPGNAERLGEIIGKRMRCSAVPRSNRVDDLMQRFAFEKLPLAKGFQGLQATRGYEQVC